MLRHINSLQLGIPAIPFVAGINNHKRQQNLSQPNPHTSPVVYELQWFIDNTQGLQLVIAVATALAIERPVYLAMKNGFKRRRPPEVIPGFTGFIEASDRFSFPSGHTSAAFLFATLYCSLVTVAMAPLVYTWAILVGLSRVFLGVHFPTDIVIGAMLGTTAALLAISITMK